MADELTQTPAEQPQAPAAKKKKPAGKAAKRKRRMAINRWLRLAIQIVFFIMAPGVFNSAMNGIHYLCNQVGATQAIEPTSFVVILVAVCVYTILFGRFFCGYACAFGTMGDVFYLLGTPLRRVLPLKNIDDYPALVKGLRLLKAAVLLAVCALCFTSTWSKVSPYSPWTIFGILDSGTLEGLTTLGVVLLVLIIITQMLCERSFCRFLCPMGAVFSFLPVLPFSLFGRRLAKCGKKPCGQCLKNCPAGLYPDKDDVASGECFSCGRCAEVCPLENVHIIDIDKPAKFAFKGSSVVYTLAKAVALFVLFYFIGALR